MLVALKFSCNVVMGEGEYSVYCCCHLDWERKLQSFNQVNVYDDLVNVKGAPRTQISQPLPGLVFLSLSRLPL